MFLPGRVIRILVGDLQIEGRLERSVGDTVGANPETKLIEQAQVQGRWRLIVHRLTERSPW